METNPPELIRILESFNQIQYISYLELGSTDELKLPITIQNKKFSNNSYKQYRFSGITFLNCTFESIDFIDCVFYDCIFQNCVLTKGHHLNTSHYETTFYQSHLQDLMFNDIEFKNCNYLETYFKSVNIDGLKLHTCIMRDFYIEQCTIAQSMFRALHSTEDTDSGLFFNDSDLNAVTFIGVEFDTGHFENCIINYTSFINCIIGASTFINSDGDDYTYNYVDFQTISNSDNINLNTLKTLFGIHNDDVKDYIKDMVTEFEFQSVFISFSFADKAFAQMLNDSLSAKGVRTFFWPIDSQAGKRLKDIMSSGVNQKDRLLFIASENSIKSEACQYELTQGRKKQDKTWEDVFFPIHIDNYLFEVKKEKIPKSKREEYWQNIEEIIDFNSLDFSDFVKPDYDSAKFDLKVSALVKSLRQKK